MSAHLDTIRERLRNTYRDDALWAAIEGVEEELRRADAVVDLLLDTADRYEMKGQGITALALIAVADVAMGVGDGEQP